MNIREKLLQLLRLREAPVVKLYTGYGNRDTCVIYGHTLSLSPLPRKRYRSFFLINALALLRLFMIKILPNASLSIEWDGEIYHSTSQSDGFFKIEWRPALMPPPGVYNVAVNMFSPGSTAIIASGIAKIIIPHPNPFAFISDIDDTFLISYSGNLRKRLFVLLTENALSRKPFEGVVNHYQLLANAQAGRETLNPFFFVSSSEWNLYDYIRDFSEKFKLPHGVYLLNQIKTFREVFKTGQNNHGTKFMRITRVMEAFPDRKFILLGDDSQEDPTIYSAVIEHFKGRIFCVYIRRVGKKPKPAVTAKLEAIAFQGVSTCYFRHSAEAVIHSRKIGLILHA